MENDQAESAVETTPEEDLLNAIGDEPQEEPVEGAEEGQEPEAQEEQPAVSQKFRVKVKNDAGADEDRDLSLEELAAGYMQSADYTRKTQAAAAQEKQRQEQFQQAVQYTTQQAQQQLGALQNLVLASAAPELQNVNWQQLAMDDPARYVQLQAKQQQLSQVLGAIQQQQNNLKQQSDFEGQRQREQAMRHSLDYLSREIPGFNLEKEVGNLRDVAKRYAFSEDEIGSVTDGRFIHLLHDAAKWRELQAAKPKAMQKVVNAPKVLRPAAPQPKNRGGELTKRLKESGRFEDLAAFL